MRSDKQNRASKANGRRSKGPVTDAGKRNSAQNAISHNLSAGNLVLLSTEDQRDFQNHQVAYLNRFQPIDTVELDLVQKMISASWRERRVSTMESALFEVEMARQRADIDLEFEQISAPGRQVLALFGAADTSAAFGLLLRYGAAARRAYAAAFRTLRELQGDRFNNAPNAGPVRPVEYLPPASDSDPAPEGGESSKPTSEPPSATLARDAAQSLPGIRLRCERAQSTRPDERELQNIDLQNEPTLHAAAANGSAVQASVA